MIRIGVLGMGNRVSHMAAQLQKLDEKVSLAAVYDAYPDLARKKIAERGLREKPDEVRIYDDPAKMLASEKLDGLMVGTRCSRHTEMACLAAPTGLPLFLEKPVATSLEEVRRLRNAFASSKSQLVVSFPLRTTLLGVKVRQIVDSGALGDVQHLQYINNVPYGHGYFKSWYRDLDETGGQWLQKATHDLDMIHFLLRKEPVLVAAMQSQRVFGGDKPAGLKCRDCPEQDTCQESPTADFIRGDTSSDVADSAGRRMCAFGSDTKIEDNGSCLIEYADGCHAVYSQNFFVRRDAGYRGANVIGYKGTAQFDFKTMSGRLIRHHENMTEDFKVAATGGHGGGDTELLRNFRAVCLGREESIAPLADGIRSAYLCLKARQSALEKRFLPVDVQALA